MRCQCALGYRSRRHPAMPVEKRADKGELIGAIILFFDL
jgi:hypothetical protein